jgi:hypothetical protein
MHDWTDDSFWRLVATSILSHSLYSVSPALSGTSVYLRTWIRVFFNVVAMEIEDISLSKLVIGPAGVLLWSGMLTLLYSGLWGQ